VGAGIGRGGVAAAGALAKLVGQFRFFHTFARSPLFPAQAKRYRQSAATCMEDVSRDKRLLGSIGLGLLITGALTCAALLIDNRGVSRVLLWQAAILVRLAGNGPLLGYDNQGQPEYEGSPVLLVLAYGGIMLGVPIYASVIYCISAFLAGRRSRNRTPPNLPVA
jgi:hypothetical protein